MKIVFNEGGQLPFPTLLSFVKISQQTKMSSLRDPRTPLKSWLKIEKPGSQTDERREKWKATRVREFWVARESWRFLTSAVIDTRFYRVCKCAGVVIELLSFSMRRKYKCFDLCCAKRFKSIQPDCGCLGNLHCWYRSAYWCEVSSSFL